jgi:hypothetical protein
MHNMITGYVVDGLKALFWQIFGLLSWSQWAVLIVLGIVALSVTVKLPGMLLSLVTLPLRGLWPKCKKGNYDMIAALMTVLLFTGVGLVLWWVGSSPAPAREVVQAAPVRLWEIDAPKIKPPDIDLSGVAKKLAEALAKLKLPRPPEGKEDPEKARKEEERRLAELKKRQEAEARARALARKMEIRARNEWAKAVINAELEQGMQTLMMQNEIRRREEQARWEEMTRPRVIGR